MEMLQKGCVAFEDAKMLFLNFSGREGKFNKPGDRNFCLALSQDEGDALLAEGWNVKTLKARTEDDDDLYYLPVAVSYKYKEPNVYFYSTRAKTRLTEDTINLVDSADIINSDIVISPYDWEVNGKSGRKAYLKTAFFTLEETPFDAKYSSDPDGDAPF